MVVRPQRQVHLRVRQRKVELVLPLRQAVGVGRRRGVADLFGQAQVRGPSRRPASCTGARSASGRPRRRRSSRRSPGRTPAGSACRPRRSSAGRRGSTPASCARVACSWSPRRSAGTRASAGARRCVAPSGAWTTSLKKLMPPSEAAGDHDLVLPPRPVGRETPCGWPRRAAGSSPAPPAPARCRAPRSGCPGARRAGARARCCRCWSRAPAAAGRRPWPHPARARPAPRTPSCRCRPTWPRPGRGGAACVASVSTIQPAMRSASAPQSSARTSGRSAAVHVHAVAPGPAASRSASLRAMYASSVVEAVEVLRHHLVVGDLDAEGLLRKSTSSRKPVESSRCWSRNESSSPNVGLVGAEQEVVDDEGSELGLEAVPWIILLDAVLRLRHAARSIAVSADLAAVGARQRVDELHRLRRHVALQPGEAMPDHLALAEPRAGSSTTNAFTACPRSASATPTTATSRTPGSDWIAVLHLARADLLAAALDDVVLARDEVEPAVLVGAKEVAGVQHHLAGQRAGLAAASPSPPACPSSRASRGCRGPPVRRWSRWAAAGLPRRRASTPGSACRGRRCPGGCRAPPAAGR